jgi:hypothetical protein
MGAGPANSTAPDRAGGIVTIGQIESTEFPAVHM